MTARRALLRVLALLLLAPSGGALLAATETFAAVSFGPGKHPKRHTLWVRAPAIDRRMVISLSYERDHGPATRGEVSGRCSVIGRSAFSLRPMRVVDFQAGEYYWVSHGFDEGELVSCELVFRRMPKVPEGGSAKVRVGVAEQASDQASPWVEILSVTPAAGRRLLDRQRIEVDVRVTNPTSHTLELHVALIEARTGFSPGISTRDEPARLAPGETARFLRTLVLGCGAADPERTEWVRAGLFDPERSVLHAVFDGAEIRTTRRHPFRLRCSREPAPRTSRSSG